jgi:hypothetical protein
MSGDAPVRPRDRHPAFYGSYDRHSAVEMHRALLRFLRGPVGAAHRRGAALVRNDIDAAVGWGALADRGVADGRGGSRMSRLAVGILPGPADEPLFGPAVVSDASDGQTAHLQG